MRNRFKVLRFIVFVAIFSVVLAGCFDDSGDSDGSFFSSDPSIGLKITGLSSYNGKYIVAEGGENGFLACDSVITANLPSNMEIAGALVSNGEAFLTVWVQSGSTVVQYKGSDTYIKARVLAKSNSSFVLADMVGNDTYTIGQLGNVQFSSGNATKAFVP